MPYRQPLRDDAYEHTVRINDAIADAKGHKPGFRLFATRKRSQLAKRKAGASMKAKALLRRLP